MTDDSPYLRTSLTRSSRPGLAANDDRSPTIRTTPVDWDDEALPDQAAYYAAPRPLPKATDHKTIDMVPVRLAPEINPRHAPTRRVSAFPLQSKAPELFLGGVVAALLLAVLILGALRLLERSPSAAPSLRPAPQQQPSLE